MDTSDWLQQYAPGFEALCDEERQRINEFSWLWSLFEAKALNENGSANAIVELAKQWARRGQLTADPFSQEFAYFRDRYVADGAFTDHFEHLRLRKNDAPSLVQKVLNGEDAKPEEVAAVVLIIVYRFRNNLSVSNSSSGRRWKLDHAPAVGDPTHMVEFGTGRRAFAREA